MSRRADRPYQPEVNPTNSIARDPLINITSAIYDLLNTNLNSNTPLLEDHNKHLITIIHQLESMIVLMNMIHKNTHATNLKMDDLNFKIDQFGTKVDKMKMDLDKITNQTHAMAGSLDTLVTLEKNQ